MNLEQAFLDDICANLEDDAPRLIFADWLEDRGDEARAEFIRVQCRLARLRSYEHEAVPLWVRQQDLLAQHGNKWKKPLANITTRCEFERGFLSRVEVTASKFVSHGEEIRSRIPLRQLGVFQTNKDWSKFLACETLHGVQALDLSSTRLGMKRGIELARCPHLSGLRELDLSHSQLRERGVQALVTSEALQSLRSLDISSNDLPDASLLQWPVNTLPKLRQLSLLGNLLSEVSVRPLIAWQGRERLERLSLYLRNDSDFVPLLQVAWPRLEHLTLVGSAALLDIFHQELLASPHFASLRELTLHTAFTEGLRPLLHRPAFTRLESLDLNFRNRMLETEAQALLRSPVLAHLRALSLHGDGYLVAFLQSAPLDSLTELHVIGGPATELAMGLAMNPALGNLRRLSLVHGSLTNRGVQVLADCEALHHLVDLDLSWNNLGPNCLPILTRPGLWPNLRRLRLAGLSDLNPANLGLLHERFGAHVVETR
jgi:uncharacterized protein (TIGR02996 family)